MFYECYFYMNIQKYIILILIINIMTLSCVTTQPSKHYTFDYQYKIVQNKLLHKNYTGAIQDLLRIKKIYPFDPYPQQIHLDLIYAYYKSYDLQAANDSIQKFLKLYPNHKNLDYILYMNGIVNMSLDKKNWFFLSKYFNIHWDNLNPNYAHNAFHSFLKLIHQYPNSQYCDDAYKRLIILKNRIAEYELSVIKFYYKRNAYISVIVRSEKMLRYFPDTQATLHGLYYMKRAYQNIHLLDQSNKINQIINKNLNTY